MKIYTTGRNLLLLFTPQTRVISAIANMFASSLRSVTRNGPLAARSFSSTAATSAAEVKSLGVIGAGQMVSNMHGQRGLFSSLIKLQGLGIALVAAQKAGVPVTLVDTSQASLDKGLKFAGKYTLSSFCPRLLQ